MLACIHTSITYVHYSCAFLDMVVSHPSLLGKDFSVNGKEKITIRNLLLHNAGFPPDPQVNYCKDEFGAALAVFTTSDMSFFYSIY